MDKSGETARVEGGSGRTASNWCRKQNTGKNSRKKKIKTYDEHENERGQTYTVLKSKKTKKTVSKVQKRKQMRLKTEVGGQRGGNP